MTVDRVVEMEGVLRKKPAPAVAEPEKKDIPRRRRGLKDAERVSSTEGVEAWNGSAVTLVSSLRS